MAANTMTEIWTKCCEVSTSGVIVGGLLLMAALLNIKNIPPMWHIRLVTAVLYHSRWNRSEPNASTNGIDAIFQPLTTKSRSPFYECDLNLHKSDSTYFSDLDINRFHLISKLCKGVFNPSLLQSQPGELKIGKLSVALGGTCCIFRREIEPYAAFEIHSRVLSWDHKWMYIISHFVEAGSHRKLRNNSTVASVHAALETASGSEEKSTWQKERCRRAVFTSAISKYVFKEGKRTVEPNVALQALGLLPSGYDVGLDEKSKYLSVQGASLIEKRRRKGLVMAEHLLALGDMHDLFEESAALPSQGVYGIWGRQGD